MARAALLAVWILAGVLLCAPAASQARAAGGTQVGDPAQAPWSVRIVASSGSLRSQCSGSIVDPTHVLTAAHCTFVDAAGHTSWPLAGYRIEAGATTAGSPLAQQRRVTAVRVHPGYLPPGAGDDVALLTLSAPLTLTAGVRPVAVAGAGDGAPVGAPLQVVGWGPSSLPGGDGEGEDEDGGGGEHVLQETVLQPTQCYGGVPSALCAIATDGAGCPGDSGAGAVTLDARPRLVAVLDQLVGGACGAGTLSGYTDLTTPELAAWLGGDDSPAPAPRGVSAPVVSGYPYVGGTLSCAPATWAGASASSVEFIDGASFQVLAQGAATYVPANGDAGRTIACLSLGSSAGGTTQWRSSAITVLGRIDPQLSLAIEPSGALHAGAGAPVPLTLTFTRAKKVAKTLRFSAATAPKKVPALHPGSYHVCLATSEYASYAAANVCVAWIAHGRASTLVTLGRVRALAGARYAVQLHAARVLAGKRLKLRWRLRHCVKRCHVQVRSRTVKARKTTTISSRPLPAHSTLRLQLLVPALRSGGVPYDATSRSFAIARRR